MIDITLIPESFRTFLQTGNTIANKWDLLPETEAKAVASAIQMEYPWHKDIFPFAERLDTEDTAVFFRNGDSIGVKIIHSGSSKGFEIDGEFHSFEDFLKRIAATTS